MNRKDYQLTNGKTLEDVTQAVIDSLKSSQMEYQVYDTNGRRVIQGRAEDHSFVARLTGTDEAVTVFLIPLGNDAFRAEIGKGKWLDKAASALLCLSLFPPTIFCPALGLISQMTLPSKLHSAIRKCLASAEPQTVEDSAVSTATA